MSGITPLIDTLLHQVLGRQGEVSLQRALSEPVKPVSSGEGPRPIQGDSDLDGRPPAALNDLRRMPGSLGGERQFTPGEPQGTAPGSTQTHFSPAARSIADVLLRFPAPPAVIRPPSPLVTLQGSPAASEVAGRLEASVRDSGLFYESHLKRWFQGDMSRQQLMREPQMQPGPRPLMVPLATQPLLPSVPFLANAESLASRTNALITPGSALVYVPNDKAIVERSVMPSAAPAQSNFPAAPDVSNTPSREIIAYEREIEHMKHRGHRDIVHESLQSLVRQQLDMLVMPAVRWEGDVWAGIFMALVIHLPTHDKTQENQQENSDPDEGWRSEMQLEVPNVGAFSVSLWFYRAVLSIDLTTADKATHHHLEKDIPALERRLGALDLEKVQVRARYMPLESSHDRAG
ncbi:MAG: flagellar hook-length control protein FliK [Halomonadaceae bacterium]|uniref:Flagellar hook-length control protein FliK n=1 Tax=Halomonas colorata TaxID=2742615 RepID=A0ABR9FTA4_9GAMM|nr:flagellar hook-length control protein FliK [Halomonas colorata]MBE0461874.1 flagellar hook-length control protein FliK [Halomonas colorata]